MDNILICGDFNLNNIQWDFDSNLQQAIPKNYNSTLGYTLVDLIHFNNLKQLNTLKNKNNRTLDLLLTNLPHIKLCATNDPISRIDGHHPPFIADINLRNALPLTNISTMKHNYFKADYLSINNALSNIDWDHKFKENPNVNSIVNIFYETIKDLIKIHVPMTKPRNNKYPPWFTNNLIKMLKEKEKYRIKFKKFKNGMDEVQYNILKERTNQVIKKSYKNYISKIENDIIANPKRFWSYIKSKRNNSSGIPSKMHYHNEIAADGPSIANLFAKNFSSVYTDVFRTTTNDNPLSVLNVPSLHSICLTKYNIERKLQCLDINKGVGYDDVPPVFLKACAKHIAYPLYIIFNLSLKQGIFPSQWKYTLVVPVPKDGDKTNVQYYRPICLLSTVAKVFEALVCPHLIWHTKQLLSKQQHGFFKKRSTTTNLVSFIEFTLKEMSIGGEVDAIYTDFSKAFDKVPHSVLVQKLSSHFGVGGPLLDWCRSYLSDRLQTVVVNGFRSDSFYANSGVPQGSHLGPLLFLMFINDIQDHISYSNYELYADDLKLFRTVKTKEDTDKLQNDINGLITWCKINKMELNAKKCYFIKFSRKKNKMQNKYVINDVQVSQVEEIRDLGVVLDSELKFVPHINNIVNKSFKMLGFIYRNTKDFRTDTALKLLFFSLVRSIIEYNSIVWSPFYKNHIERIESVQRKFTKRIAYLNQQHYKKDYTDRLKLFNMISLDQRRTFLGQTFLFKLLNDQIDSPNLLSKINIRVPRTSARVCNLQPLFVAHTCTKYTGNSPLNNLCKSYNSLFSNLFADHGFDIFSNSFNKFKNIVLNSFKVREDA
ncbi:hypothetical protein JYU34_006003 [Plutella xylostella]|uniref:Reverse transcriptase domain-containing protein n=2 Tax=Plutella xylostella TaxID=51655 RepID=A0ABQ7QUQ7_PLUXY|nr:hypothetical protein JYU34_006003 [Plutella xylostella]